MTAGRILIKKEILILGLTIICFVSFASFAYSQWSSVNPPNVSKDWLLTEVHFTSPDEGWAVGADTTNKRGVLLRYSWGTWTSLNPPNVSQDWFLRGVCFYSLNEGWAVGCDKTNRQGVLLHYSLGTR